MAKLENAVDGEPSLNAKRMLSIIHIGLIYK